MGTDQIRLKPLSPELMGGGGASFGADYLALSFCGERMHPGGIAALQAIADVVHPCGQWNLAGLDAKGHQLMPGLGRQSSHDVPILSGEGLMHEQDLQRD